MPGVRVAELTKRFGDTVALAGVDLDIRPGELFTLLGPSGCGKTTLLRVLAGLEQTDAGAVWFDGERVDAIPTHRRNIGMVFQNYALFPHMDVFANAAYGLRARRVPDAQVHSRVTEALRRVAMDGYGERRPDQLSGGQQQRVALARALATRPAVLLMDEPLSNLDARLRVQMRSEIRRLQREVGITTVYVTHDQEEALAISDRIAVMEEGRLLQVGTPAEIYHRPASLRVAAFVGTCFFVERQGVTLGLRPEQLRLAPAGAADAGLAPGTVKWPATVVEESYGGAFTTVLVRLTTGEQAAALTEAPGAYQPGETITVQFESAAALRFDTQSGEALP